MKQENVFKLKSKNWQHKLNTIGEHVTDTDDILQCYEVIFKTQKGSVICNPNLGWSVKEYLGKPLTLVANKMRPALMQALNRQEPRGIVTSVNFSYGTAEDFARGRLTVEITYTSKLTGETNTGVINL